MNQIELNNWGLRIIRDIYDFWLTLSKQNSDIEKNGFSVFYSPLIIKPSILFIGFNPGGDFKRDNITFCPHDIIDKLPVKHDYLTESWDMAVKMREIFENKLNLINESVKFNFYYFRTKDAKTLENYDEFSKIHEFCSKYTLDIINTLQPKVIITEGLKVFDLLYDLLNFNTLNYELKFNNHRLIVTACNDIFKLIGLRHPTGEKTKNLFNNYIKSISKELFKQIETSF